MQLINEGVVPVESLMQCVEIIAKNTFGGFDEQELSKITSLTNHEGILIINSIGGLSVEAKKVFVNLWDCFESGGKDMVEFEAEVI